MIFCLRYPLSTRGRVGSFAPYTLGVVGDPKSRGDGVATMVGSCSSMDR